MANTGGSQNTQNFPIVSAPGKVPVVNSIFDFSAAALAQLRLWLEQNPPAIGINNILGFSQFVASPATTVATSETTTSTSYTDLATTGPTLTGLSDGKYVIFFGCKPTNSAGAASLMSLQFNSTPADDADCVQVNQSAATTACRALVKTLSNGGNNTITAKYRVGAGTGTFYDRWLIALRYANT